MGSLLTLANSINTDVHGAIRLGMDGHVSSASAAMPGDEDFLANKDSKAIATGCKDRGIDVAAGIKPRSQSRTLSASAMPSDRDGPRLKIFPYIWYNAY